MSPDAFIQMAYQLTYYKVHGQMALTRSVHDRMFRNGRTETVRVLSAESVDFVKAMLEGGTEDRSANVHYSSQSY